MQQIRTTAEPATPSMLVRLFLTLCARDASKKNVTSNTPHNQHKVTEHLS